MIKHDLGSLQMVIIALDALRGNIYKAQEAIKNISFMLPDDYFNTADMCAFKARIDELESQYEAEMLLLEKRKKKGRGNK